MKIVVDTNVLLRAIIEDEVEQAAVARRVLAEADILVVPLVAIVEFTWVASRTYRLSSSKVVEAINLLLETDRVMCDRAAVEAGLAVLEAGGDFADGVIAYEGRRLGGATFATFDRKAAARLGKAGQDCLLLSAG